jgi:hypothetical protein
MRPVQSYTDSMLFRSPVPRGLAGICYPLAAGVVLSALSMACKKEPEKAPEPPKPAPVAAVAKPKPPPKAPIKGVEWVDPPEWKKVTPSSGMRLASYEIPPAKGDKVPGELNVFVLGGSVDANLKRWLDEFTAFDDKTVVRSDRTVNDLAQAVVELPKGTFSGGMATTKATENYGLLGAIISTPSEAKYFFKLTGPSATVKAAREPFYRLLDSAYLEGSKPAATESKPGAVGDTKPATTAAPTSTPGVPAKAPAPASK